MVCIKRCFEGSVVLGILVGLDVSVDSAIGSIREEKKKR